MNKDEILKFIATSKKFEPNKTRGSYDSSYKLSKIGLKVKVFLLIEFSSVSTVINLEKIKLTAEKMIIDVNGEKVISRNFSIK